MKSLTCKIENGEESFRKSSDEYLEQLIEKKISGFPGKYCNEKASDVSLAKHDVEK